MRCIGLPSLKHHPSPHVDPFHLYRKNYLPDTGVPVLLGRGCDGRAAVSGWDVPNDKMVDQGGALEVDLVAEMHHLSDLMDDMQGHPSYQRDETAPVHHDKAAGRRSDLAGAPGHGPVGDAGPRDDFPDDEADDLGGEWAANEAANGDVPEDFLRVAEYDGDDSLVVVMGAVVGHGDDVCGVEGVEGNGDVWRVEVESVSVCWTKVHGLTVVHLVDDRAVPAMSAVCETEEEEGHHLSCGLRRVTGWKSDDVCKVM